MKWIITLCVGSMLAAMHRVDEPAQQQSANEQPPLRVLVLTGGGYHDFHHNTQALLDGLAAMKDVQPKQFDVLWCGEAEPAPERFRSDLDINDPDLFTGYDATLAYCQGDLGFTDEIKDRFLSYIREGGGFVAIHSAADSHPGWDEYDIMLGGRFESHPPVAEFPVQVEKPDHAVMRGLGTQWTIEDEFYHLKNCSPDDKTLLMIGKSPGDDSDAPARPVTWVKEYGSGRVFYTILGHGISTHRDERFHTLIANALQWTADAKTDDAD